MFLKLTQFWCFTVQLETSMSGIFTWRMISTRHYASGFNIIFMCYKIQASEHLTLQQIRVSLENKELLKI